MNNANGSPEDWNERVTQAIKRNKDFNKSKHMGNYKSYYYCNSGI